LTWLDDGRMIGGEKSSVISSLCSDRPLDIPSRSTLTVVLLPSPLGSDLFRVNVRIALGIGQWGRQLSGCNPTDLSLG